MKKKYLIALDMDGTLLNTSRSLCDETKDYLKALHKEGYPIIITTGRPLRATLPSYKELGLTSPIICYNGTYIYDPNGIGVGERKMLPSTFIKDLIEQIGEENFQNILCENDTDIYMLRDNPALFGFFWKENMNVHFGSFNCLKNNVYIMIIEMKNHDYDDKLVQLGFSYPGLGIRFWSGEGLVSELYFLEDNKASALKKVADYYGIPNEDIIAFGDAENDLEMLELAGYSVAMKNGQETVKNKAKYISLDDNNNDGIKKTLEYFLLNN